MVKLSILIPVRNEGVNVKIMIRVLQSALDLSHEVLVIYDSPNDNSIPVIKQMQKKHTRVRGIQNKLGTGVANAIRAGVSAAVGKYILIFAADEVGPVLAVEDMVALLDRGCDLVSCTRYAHGGRRLGGSIIEGLLSKLANSLFHLLIGSSFTDSTTGIKMFKKDVFSRLDLQSNVGWAVVFEMAIKSQIEGLKLGEVPIISIDRLYGGKSTFKLGSWFKEYLKWFFYGMIKLRKSVHTKKVLVKVPQTTAV